MLNVYNLVSLDKYKHPWCHHHNQCNRHIQRYPITYIKSHLPYLFMWRWHLGCFHILSIMKSASVNTRVQISLSNIDFISFQQTLRGRIPGSYHSSIFSFSRKLHTAFVTAMPFYIPTKTVQGTSLWISSQPCQHLSVFLVATLTNVSWYLIVVWFTFPW